MMNIGLAVLALALAICGQQLTAAQNSSSSTLCTGSALECGDSSPLWDHSLLHNLDLKAVTSPRTPKLSFRIELNQDPKPTQTPTQSAAPAVDEWGDEFDGDKLDDTKWELYTFEGGGS